MLIGHILLIPFPLLHHLATATIKATTIYVENLKVPEFPIWQPTYPQELRIIMRMRHSKAIYTGTKIAYCVCSILMKPTESYLSTHKKRLRESVGCLVREWQCSGCEGARDEVSAVE